MPILAIDFPNFNPVAVAIGPIVIRWYALAYIVGIVLGWIYARALIKRERLWGGPAPVSLIQFDDFILWVTLGIIIGGRTGEVLFWNFPYYYAHPLEIFQLWNGGMSFHGGYLGCAVAVIAFALTQRISILSLGDLTCAVAPIGIFLGRVANFVNGELWGRVTDGDLPWAVIFPHAGPQPRHPSQLYEAGLEGLLLFVVLAIMVRMGALKRQGMILGAFTIVYGCARIVGELFREPDAPTGFVFGQVTMGQLLSVPMIVIGLVLIVRAWRLPDRSALNPGGA
ncbi:prolipoprotein diacylglyceryl transferase [Rhodopseudomonas boonkerdii]|uniref:prolipoprotein diacylglyceryl transferase n=1 Tax=Rhodopseudomonas boonkerdii TaxID=475937 RepID=UPI001E5A520B|nr:prolipoprotein diacylglyceryl transferase [Rhodopseudomonas boonkerdii]UGV25420.1 prolipoprotein diacylglyceryl transferase [Rhodopseudomonas boonkerdii]